MAYLKPTSKLETVHVEQLQFKMPEVRSTLQKHLPIITTTNIANYQINT